MIQEVTHDALVQRFIQLQGKITFRTAMAFFLNGITGECVRGRQVIISYLYMRKMPLHDFVGKDLCAICGLPAQDELDPAECLETSYSGHAWNEQPIKWVFDLEEALTLEVPPIAEHHLLLLQALLAVVAEVQPDETPGMLEKRVAASKILKKTDKYKRYGILQALAELGIMRNDSILPRYDGFITHSTFLEAHHRLRQTARSDIVLPLAGWNSLSSINVDRLNEIIDLVSAPG